MTGREKLIKIILKWMEEARPDDSDIPSYLADAIEAAFPCIYKEQLNKNLLIETMSKREAEICINTGRDVTREELAIAIVARFAGGAK